MIVIGIGEGGILQLGQQEDETKSNFSFTNINSIFRQKLTFFDQDNEVATPEIQNFTISFSDNSFVNKYFPWTNGEMWSTSSDAYNYGPIKIENPDLTDGNIYFSTTFYNGNQDIIFTAYTSDGKTYTCTKNYPEGGFKNNKYYYGDAKLILESGPSYLLPTITGLTNYTSSIINSSLGDFLQIDVLDDPANFTIGGTSQNVTFAIQGVKDYNITFDNIDAIIETPFIYDNNSNQPNCLTLNLKGDNTIMTKMAADAINTIPLSTGGYPYTDLKLSCEGAEATLTLKTQGSSYCGLVFKNTPTSNTWDSDGPLDAEALKDIAADGYTVERSATSYDDATLTYVWTYTVKKINITGMKDYEARENGKGETNYYIKDNPADITISGNSNNQTFILAHGGTVSLNNLKSNVSHSLPWDLDETNCFVSIQINAENGLTLNLTGDNEVFMSNGYPNFHSEGANLQFKCEGDQATLSLITNIQGDPGSGIQNYAGFAGFMNIDFTSSGSDNSFVKIENENDKGYDDLQKLAADDDGDGNPDYIITRSAASAQQQMFYKWTYTITKIKP